MAHADRLPAARLMGGIPPTALVLLGIVSVQVGAAFAKQLFTVAGAAGTVTLRLVMAALVLVVIWRPSVRLDRRTLVTIATYGAVLAAMNLCFYAALDRIPLGAAVTIEFLGPLAVAVAGSRRWIDGVWVLLAGVGVVLLTGVQGGLLWTGVLFALAAGACWAAYILVTARLGSQTTDGKGLALAMVVGAVIALPFGVGSAGTAMLDPLVLAAGFAVALMSSVVPYSLELEALRRMPPRVFGILMSMEPAVAAVAGLLLLGEHLKAAQWAAVCCVVIASIGATRSARPDV
ncbi:EamA family transporter [Lentzea flaviverrucosa]|uniref:Inner membrane transporter RhtA n=1 Tax=Lentzea flaviverrucosa TaxID=200379 RepID=A0A1H9WN64_9PSEU|nr:EamA family transporter [Lentzea flaviverrucosa]RDI22946.1 inner membrane transporter RhtA [Lentzea flaviverrucosa]SES35376.1 inner membrane transporter RhtA [Lentzea flaviverrucosa]